jgi:hypothetical protein
VRGDTGVFRKAVGEVVISKMKDDEADRIYVDNKTIEVNREKFDEAQNSVVRGTVEQKNEETEARSRR